MDKIITFFDVSNFEIKRNQRLNLERQAALVQEVINRVIYGVTKKITLSSNF